MKDKCSSLNRIICLAGPTAIGKTELSIEVAKALHTEIVSADSVQLYRGMDIGSAKPTLQERQGVVHHLMDCVDISDTSFSVSAYRAMAGQAIDAIANRGTIPLIVGGSGLYMDSLMKPLNFACPSDASVRAQIEEEYPAEAPSAAWTALYEVDPVTANRLHPNDRKRVIRALEVYRLSGKPLSAFGNDFANTAQSPAPYHSLMILLETDRQRLYDRIERRVDQMVMQGLEQEVRSLYEAGYTLQYSPMQSLGYKQFIEYFEGVRSFEETVEKIKLDTRHFAKRQISWFNRYSDAVRLTVTDGMEKAQLTQRILQTIHEWESAE